MIAPSAEPQGMGEAFVYLHKMPGPHNVDVRGNSRLIRGRRGSLETPALRPHSGMFDERARIRDRNSAGGSVY